MGVLRRAGVWLGLVEDEFDRNEVDGSVDDGFAQEAEYLAARRSRAAVRPRGGERAVPRDSAARDSTARDSTARDRRLGGPDTRARTGQREGKRLDARDHDIYDRDIYDREIRDRDVQGRDIQGRDIQGRDVLERGTRDRGAHGRIPRDRDPLARQQAARDGRGVFDRTDYEDPDPASPPPGRVERGEARAPLGSVRPLVRPGSSAAGTRGALTSSTQENLALAPQVDFSERVVVSDDTEPRRQQITTQHPTTYSDARAIGESFRGGVPVIMDLTDMAEADAKRLVDFAAGLVFGLHGSMDRVTNRVFLLSPQDTPVSAEDKARIAQDVLFDRD